MEFKRLYQGWGPLLGVPALFVVAYLLGCFPSLLKLPICGVKLFINVDCPGCGLTRSMVALSHGHIRTSIHYHPLGLVIALWLIYMMVRSAVYLVRGRPLPELLSSGQRFFLLNVFLIALFFQWALGFIAPRLI